MHVYVCCKLLQVKLTSRDPSPPPVDYVRGGGGIFKDMAVHDLDMSRFLMGREPKVRRTTRPHRFTVYLLPSGLCSRVLL